MITNGVVDRTVQNWIADELSRSTVKNTIAVLVRVRHRHHPVDLDRAASDHTRARRADRQGHEGQAGPPGSCRRGDPPPRRQRILSAGPNPDARLFTGPRGGRISTAVLRDATHGDDVVTKLGYEHLRRHDLRQTGLTWFADAGVHVHVLRRIAGHGSLTTTQRYLHPDVHKITAAGAALSAHFNVLRAPRSLPSPFVMTR
ncbi:tyrosine-type recombinase/integrase [Streptomyces sp. NPDC008125]|uniref:tyrosine-type recombinase/integrase n=1 Tax=Streptomyces sp. NPDC008125 TaxID=3364811 RepID=UPI0036ECC64F